MPNEKGPVRQVIDEYHLTSIFVISGIPLSLYVDFIAVIHNAFLRNSSGDGWYYTLCVSPAALLTGATIYGSVNLGTEYLKRRSSLLEPVTRPEAKKENTSSHFSLMTEEGNKNKMSSETPFECDLNITSEQKSYRLRIKVLTNNPNKLVISLSCGTSTKQFAWQMQENEESKDIRVEFSTDLQKETLTVVSNPDDSQAFYRWGPLLLSENLQALYIPDENGYRQLLSAE